MKDPQKIVSTSAGRSSSNQSNESASAEDEKRGRSAKPIDPAFQTVIDHDFLFLHIGKTGGTSIGALLSSLRKTDPDFPIASVGHFFSVDRILSLNPNAKIGFVIRDPADRFVSGFNSRLRSGRPAHETMWTEREAITFNFFPTANDLAEALYASDQRRYSAARFAMDSINHLRRGYHFHLGSVEALKARRDRFYSVVDLNELDERIGDFLEPAGVDHEAIRHEFKRLHVAPKAEVSSLKRLLTRLGTSKSSGDEGLSPSALRNLRKFWSVEYEIYDYCYQNLRI